MRRLDLTRIDLAHNAPSGHISQRKDKDGHNDDPSSSTLATDHAIGSVQTPDDQHAGHENQAAGDDDGTSTKLVD